ncbi:MAG TPA: hypothetical protein VFQ00_06020 [Terriglobales bacterium]|nr:hypothetical protein [Terriglobales bacterium]
MFTQAPIAVENKQLFGELKDAVENALSPARADAFLQGVKRSGLRVRQFEQVLQARVLDQLPGKHPSRVCVDLFAELSSSDQGLLREFYLTHIENVPNELREKYSKLYRYE